MSKPNQQIRQTEPFSVVNNRILDAACSECTASRDWKTFHNWQRQGMRVRKGQHGLKIVDLKRREDDNQDDDVGDEFWQLVPVFCKHQVEKMTGKSANGQENAEVEQD
jgi:antirestriction protein ArdC